MMLNSICTELEKANDSKKDDLEKEIIDFVDLHDLLEKYSCTTRHSSKRVSIRATAHDMLSISDPGNSNMSQQRLPFLATSSIFQLQQTALKLHKVELSNGSATSQNHSQSSSAKTSNCSKVVSFVLDATLRQIRSSSVVKKEDPLNKLMYGELKILAPPLLKIIFLLKSRPSTMNQKKGKKGNDDRKETLHLALICLKEFAITSLGSSQGGSLLEDLLSVSKLEYGFDYESEESTRIDDQHTRNKVLFIEKLLKPLISELLSLSREVEVNK